MQEKTYQNNSEYGHFSRSDLRLHLHIKDQDTHINHKKTNRLYYEYYEWTDKWPEEYYEWIEKKLEVDWQG